MAEDLIKSHLRSFADSFTRVFIIKWVNSDDPGSHRESLSANNAKNAKNDNQSLPAGTMATGQSRPWLAALSLLSDARLITMPRISLLRFFALFAFDEFYCRISHE
jgi:hypothetical protein